MLTTPRLTEQQLVAGQERGLDRLRIVTVPSHGTTVAHRVRADIPEEKSLRGDLEVVEPGDGDGWPLPEPSSHRMCLDARTEPAERILFTMRCREDIHQGQRDGYDPFS